MSRVRCPRWHFSGGGQMFEGAVNVLHFYATYGRLRLIKKD